MIWATRTISFFSEPGQPTITKYRVYVGMMTAVLALIYATYLYYSGEPDGTRLYRNALVWGLPYGYLLYRKQAASQ